MEVRPGYKQTEVGVIPKDWEVSSLGDLCLTSSGTTPARALQDRYYKNGTIGWVKTHEGLPHTTCKSITISRTADSWFIAFAYEQIHEPTVKSHEVVGVDTAKYVQWVRFRDKAVGASELFKGQSTYRATRTMEKM